MLRRLLIYITLFSLSSCSSYTHEHFQSTRLEHDVYTYVINDELQLTMRSPGDLAYAENKRSIRKSLKDQSPCLKDALQENGNILWYAKTTIPPHYDFWVIAEPDLKLFNPDCPKVIWSAYDGDKQLILYFLGIPTEERSRQNMIRDLSKMQKELKTGANYLKEIN
jgi:hypothetical protein